MVLLCGLLIIAVTVAAVFRKVDVRLALCLGALALGVVAGDPMRIVRKFLATLTTEQFVVPICSAMGFAYVLRLTQCDQHLVQLLVQPLRRGRALLIPGAVLVGFVVNIPVVSQTSTAVCIGAVLVPLLRAAGVSPITIGAALLLGSSLGGELLNPGAPEIQTVSSTLRVEATECVARLFPLLMVQLAVGTSLFWLLSWRAEQKHLAPAATLTPGEAAPLVRVNLLKAAMPLVPLLLLFLTGPPLRLITVPTDWLADAPPPALQPENLPEEAAREVQKQRKAQANSRLIGAAMLVGVVLTAVVGWRTAGQTARAFFEGAGYALVHIISVIVAAACFGQGVEQIGLGAALGGLLEQAKWLLLPLAGLLTWSFALVSGSGMAATQALYKFFVGADPRVDPKLVGAVVSLGAAAGRTMSPVAAVALMSASLTETEALALVRRVALPLLVGLAAVIVTASLIAHGP